MVTDAGAEHAFTNPDADFGVRQGMAISSPAVIKDKGGIRN
jgi:hypothetical protein